MSKVPRELAIIFIKEGYTAEMYEIFSKRLDKFEIDIYKVFHRLGHDAGIISQYFEEGDLLGEVPHEVSEAVENFFTCFSMVSKFMYPVMEQLETTVSRNCAFRQ